MNQRKYFRIALMLCAMVQVCPMSIAQSMSQPPMASGSVLPSASPSSSATATQWADTASASVEAQKAGPPTVPPPVPAAVSNAEESKKDSGSYDNVISALLGAVLAFFATQYNERRNWERKKSEQLREKQFGKLSDAARALDSSSVVISVSYSKLELLMRRAGTLGSTSNVVEAELHALGRQASKDVAESLRALKLAIIDLQICRAHGVPIDTCLAAQQELAKARAYFESLAPGGVRQDYTIVASAASELAKLSETFAAAALDSLAG